MSRSIDFASPWIERLQHTLQEGRYSYRVTQQYLHAARRFLRCLDRRKQALELSSPSDVDHYLNGLKSARDWPPLPVAQRRRARTAIRMLMRLVHDGRWPPEFVATDADETAMQVVVDDYDAWMAELRGLSSGTRKHNRFEAYSLLRWLRDHERSVAALCVADLDAYIAWRVRAMRRRTKVNTISTLRSVLRYLHGSNLTPWDLSATIDSPSMYDLEDIPSTVPREDIDRALAAARRDRSPMGRRDYAIWMLLTTYGLRSGEIRGLRLADVDWRNDRLHIRHSKTGAHSELPLLRAPADALLDYLKHGRPETTRREVFLQAVAPYGPLSAGLHRVIDRPLRAVGGLMAGKRGVHALRHSRAQSLLKDGISIKVIGDVLGHHSEHATAAYLKLATDDLRSIALDVPPGVAA